MRKFWPIVIGALLLCAAGFVISPRGRLIIAFAVEDLSRDTLVKKIEAEAHKQSAGWGVQAPHSLDVFEHYRERAEIEKILARAGFEKAEELSAQARMFIDGEFELGSDTYVGNIGGLPCNETFYVFLWFDASDFLTKVKSAQFEAGCL
jgi:hypothetical protein